MLKRISMWYYEDTHTHTHTYTPTPTHTQPTTRREKGERGEGERALTVMGYPHPHLLKSLVKVQSLLAIQALKYQCQLTNTDSERKGGRQRLNSCTVLLF